MSYYAQFDLCSGAIFRFDTRIYLNGLPTSSADGKCVAALVGKNPGSAKSSGSSGWASLTLGGDKLLPTVRNIFIEAYNDAKKPIPAFAFVQIWNLFYLCDKTLSSATDSVGKIIAPPICKSEQNVPDVVWFAWGGSNVRLDHYKARFQKTKTANAFFYNHRTKTVTSAIPALSDFAKHTQGLPARPVIKHLAKIL